MATDDDNATIERMVSEGKSAMAIRAAVPNVSRTNVYLKIAKFKKHGTVGRVQTKTLGRPRAMGEGVDKFLQGLLAAKPDMELDEMRRHLQNELQLTVSMSTISRAISRAGIASGQRRSSTAAAVPRRRITTAIKAAAQKEPSHTTTPTTTTTTTPQQPPPLALHMPHEQVSLDHLTQLPNHVHLLDPWQDMPVPPLQHSHAPQHHMHIHELDPSLTPAYHSAAVYHNMYPDTDPHAMALSASSIDVYRSPYAPM
jgi:transposase